MTFRLKNSKWIFNLQKSMSKLIFAGSKNPVRNRLKIQFVELDFPTWFFKNEVQMDRALDFNYWNFDFKHKFPPPSPGNNGKNSNLNIRGQHRRQNHSRSGRRSKSSMTHSELEFRCEIFGFFLLSFPQNENKIY